MSLVAHDLGFAYPAGPWIFRHLDLVVDPGERVCLSAPSGTGKTTLCRVLAGHLAAREGSVTVDGEDCCRRARPIAPRPVQLVAQHPEQAVDPLMRMDRTLREGVATVDDSDAAIEASGLLERFGIRPAWLRRYPRELSGGELMRFVIVRALLARPRYLICDEMTAMLDAYTQAQVWHEVLDVAGERAMGLVVVTHSPMLQERLATRVVTLTRPAEQGDS